MRPRPWPIRRPALSTSAARILGRDLDRVGPGLQARARRKLCWLYWRAIELGVAESTSRPCSSSIARSQKRSTAPMSWVTNRIVRPAASRDARTRRSTSAGKGVADREHLVDQEDVGVDLDHRREGEPNVHPRRVVLELRSTKSSSSAKAMTLSKRARACFAAEPQHRRVDDHVVARGQVQLKPTPSSMNGDSRPLTQVAGVDAVDPGETLQQRALAAAVAPDDPEELARRDLERDVLDGLQHVVGP